MAMARDKWDAEAEALIKRFRTLKPLPESFELRPGSTVIDPVKFHASLEGDIQSGPRGPRARTGAILGDLRDYSRVQEGRSSEEKPRETA